MCQTRVSLNKNNVLCVVKVIIIILNVLIGWNAQHGFGTGFLKRIEEGVFHMFSIKAK